MIPGANSVGQVGLLRNDALGDTLLVLPAAAAIKRYDRNIRVELVCDPAYVDLLRAHPDLDEVIADPGGKAGELARTLRSRRYDALLVLRPTPRNAWAALLARVPLRIGTGYRAYSILFNRRWFGHRRTNLKHSWTRPDSSAPGRWWPSIRGAGARRWHGPSSGSPGWLRG